MTQSMQPESLSPAAGHAGDLRPAIAKAAMAAAERIAPLWPLEHFVAVNPLMGLANQTLPRSAFTMARALGARLTMPRSYYAGLIEAGRIRDVDIAASIEELSSEASYSTSVQRVKAEVLQPDVAQERFKLPTVASLAARRSGVDWEQLVCGSISNWAADYFDNGVAIWSAAPAGSDPWQSYQAVAGIDRSAELLGLKGARQSFAALPQHSERVLELLVERLEVPRSGLQDYFHRLLADVAGWAAYARYRGWNRELRGEDGSAARQLLAVRASWELVLMDALGESGLAADFAASRQQFAERDASLWRGLCATDHVLQLAFERAVQRELAGQLRLAVVPPQREAQPAPASQAVFCIDVRSERIRRALEAESDGLETLGFAGFFGLPVSVCDNTGSTSARCPVLLEPAYRAAEDSPALASWKSTPAERKGLAGRLARLQRGGVAAFAYVEALGVGYIWSLVKAVAGIAPSRLDGSSATEAQLQASLADKVGLAENMLRGMSLTRRFGKLVVLTGHGSSSTNNPYASALDCGACGGHAGDVNASLAVSLLNDPFVRAALVDRNITIPGDTWFVAALHDTTSDEVTFLDLELVPPTHKDALARLQGEFELASRRVRAERAVSLGVTVPGAAETAVPARASDWSQVRPEWGLAGCNAFIAAPRQRTRGLALNGRSFLHEYEQDLDPENSVLETILTAPLVVASWITLQYYGSTVDNRHFGSGDKTLHNVVGGLGVLEGVGGDLRSGLPLQSLGDGKTLMHEPLRLTAVIEASRSAIDGIILKHDHLAELVDNEWIQMHALDEDGVLWRRQCGGGIWVKVPTPADAADEPLQWEAA